MFEYQVDLSGTGHSRIGGIARRSGRVLITAAVWRVQVVKVGIVQIVIYRKGYLVLELGYAGILWRGARIFS
jgi:hypothetical protein